MLNGLLFFSIKFYLANYLLSMQDQLINNNTKSMNEPITPTTKIDYKSTLAFAQQMDEADPLKEYRSQFHIPTLEGTEHIYLCGNSLGLQPKTTQAHIQQELNDWKNLGVDGHFNGKNAWFYYPHFLTEAAAKVVGANTSEVAIMNALTVNLHLMMVSFYQPTPQRYKILIESPAFPSDIYAVRSQAEHHGYNADEAVVVLKPREGEHTLHTEDIVAAIEEHGDELALVMFGGVNYYTGQYFDLKTITQAAHKVGAKAGFDCAHAAGNVVMQLHDWEVDFAVWCSYKYMNSGPGGTSGVFVHEKHGNNLELKRFAGWWGNDEKTRFEMHDTFIPQAGAAGWQMSNAQVLPMAAHKASLEIFEAAGIQNLRKKSELLTGYLEFLLEDINLHAGEELFNIITPKDPQQRGCQLSILTKEENGRKIYEYIALNGVIADWRKPNVIRVAPVPLYNSFVDVYNFARLLEEGIGRGV